MSDAAQVTASVAFSGAEARGKCQGSSLVRRDDPSDRPW